MPSSRHEEIQVRLVETDGVDEVALVSVIKNESLSELGKVS